MPETAPTLTCPRCGYDLSGVAAAEGVTPETHDGAPGCCSECGLAFAWGDIFHPERNRVRGFIEHATGGLSTLVSTAYATTWLALRPWRFWKRVRLELPPRPGRIGVWLLITIGAVWGIAAGVSLALTWWVVQGLPFALPVDPSAAYVAPLALNAVQHWGASFSNMGLTSGGIALAAPLAASLTAPIIVMLLPHTRARAKLRPAHVARGAAFGLAWFAAVLLFRAVWAVLWYVLAAATSYVLRPAPGRRTASLSESQQLLLRATKGIREFGEVLGQAWWVWALLALAWVSAWWLAAIGRGWRIERFALVWLAVMIPAWLAFLVVIAYSRYGRLLF